MKAWVGFLALACAAQTTPVIVISIDTLRGDRVGRNTPNLDRWAADGTLFTNATTPVPLTLPAHTALLTSTYPFENGVQSNAGSVPQGILTLATVLRGRGYRTGAFVGSIFLEKQLGLDTGFETYDSPFEFRAFSRLSGEALAAGPGRSARRGGPLVIRAANQWLAANSKQPAFLFVHLFDMHKPWAQPTYDAQATAVDAMLGSFRQTLERTGWWDKSLIIVTADHGEGLGEHGESDHGYFIYQSTLHVPLIVHWPKADAGRPKTVTEPVGLIDVAPSILDYLKVPRPAAFHGRSFLDGSPRLVISESVYARDSFGWAPLRSVRLGSLKYIDAPKPELYDLAPDPGEKRNLVSSRPADAARLRAELQKLKTPAVSKTRQADAELRSLGYIGPGPKTGAKAAADPKDRLPLLLRYEEALDFPAAKRALAFRQILTADPGNLLVRRDLGVALAELRQFDKAVAELNTVAAASPYVYVSRYELGSAFEAMNRFSEAADQFRAACLAAPKAVQCQAALARVLKRI
ncbi:MAG: sulfatase [Bryobacterales bacterium]|nr:sulfatase [Bryobacterales bacterium]